MKFDKQMDVLETTRVEDGMGGWTTTQGITGTIQAFTTPVKVEIMLKEYGIVSTSSLKVFTKDIIPDDLVQLQYGQIKYKILQLSDFGKLRMLLVEVV